LTAAALVRDVRAVFFDAVGTLLHPEPSAPDIYAQVGRRHGSRLSPADIAPRFKEAFARQEQLDAEQLNRTSEAREIARWRTIVAEVLDDATDRRACFVELFDHFSRPSAWRVEPETANVLTQLAAQGLTLGLASNYDHRLRSVIRGMPALCPVMHLVISAEIGWRKPSRQFFTALCSAVMLPPERILLVGDDPANDFEGAQAAGLRALLFDPHRLAAPGMAIISRLGELLGEPEA